MIYLSVYHEIGNTIEYSDIGLLHKTLKIMSINNFWINYNPFQVKQVNNPKKWKRGEEEMLKSHKA